MKWIYFKKKQPKPNNEPNKKTPSRIWQLIPPWLKDAQTYEANPGSEGD